MLTADVDALSAVTIVVASVAIVQGIVTLRDRKARVITHERDEAVKRADRLEHENASLRARTDLGEVQNTLGSLLQKLDEHMGMVNNNAKVMAQAMAHQGEILERLITTLENGNGKEN